MHIVSVFLMREGPYGSSALLFSQGQKQCLNNMVVTAQQILVEWTVSGLMQRLGFRSKNIRRDTGVRNNVELPNL